jgi:hypothetical protein
MLEHTRLHFVGILASGYSIDRTLGSSTGLIFEKERGAFHPFYIRRPAPKDETPIASAYGGSFLILPKRQGRRSDRAKSESPF